MSSVTTIMVNVLGVAASIRFSMHSGGKAARAQIFREFSGAENWPESVLESPRSSTRVQRSVGLHFGREKSG